MPKGLFVDLSRCIGCRACEVACEREHDGLSYIDVYTVEEAEVSVPYTCRHCENAPCVTVCPTKACETSSNGVVINPAKCIGCRACEIVCPFGIPVFSRKVKAITKCDLCQHRQAAGLPVACAATCPTGAIFFGEEEEFIAMRRRQVVAKMVKGSLEATKLRAKVTQQ